MEEVATTVETDRATYRRTKENDSYRCRFIYGFQNFTLMALKGHLLRVRTLIVTSNIQWNLNSRYKAKKHLTRCDIRYDSLFL